MKSILATLATATLIASASPALHAQTPPSPRFDGTLILMTGQAELEVANDEAVASFFVEVQDADLTKAQSQVNQRIAEATGSLKRNDPKGEVQSGGYSSYPVYRNDGGRKIVGWRVRQGVSLRTGDLGGLARTVAAVQPHAALGSIEFRLSRAAREKVEGELIQRAIANLNSRVAAVAQSLNVPPARIRTEELNFGVQQIERPQMMSMARAAPMAADGVAEPQFEAGRSTQQTTVTAKVRFLQP
ncbi:MAG: SIMPL domain-containing protein [Burkholderiaceae bacterium]|jgi:predicted secreted protein|nr:SIMPL domain-containing protein [Burkholderiaceae bacterium]